MRLHTKIVLTIVLVVVVWMLFGCCKGAEHFVPAPALTNGVIDAAYLQRAYNAYNDGYFHNRLTQIPIINMEENNPEFMASTICNDVCIIRFNPKFITTQRVADFTMLHEMCHVKTWGKENQMFGGKVIQVFHGKAWRGCMLTLDAEGAFREIIIDNYSEDM